MNQEALARMKRAFTDLAPPRPSDGAEANKAQVARMFLEIVNRKNYAVADEIFAPDFYWPQFDLHGPEGVKTWAQGFHRAWPDVIDTIDLQIAEGDIVMTLVSVVGTQSGAWMGLPPSGRTHAFRVVGIDRLRDGLIVERYASFDFASVAKALGHALPA